MARLTVRDLRKALDVELETVWYRLIDRISTLAGRQADMAIAADRHTDQIHLLTQLAAQQAETIKTLTRIAREQDEVISELTGKLEELAESHNALQKREAQTFRLTASNSQRLETHGAWIRELFDRVNESEKPIEE